MSPAVHTSWSLALEDWLAIRHLRLAMLAVQRLRSGCPPLAGAERFQTETAVPDLAEAAEAAGQAGMSTVRHPAAVQEALAEPTAAEVAVPVAQAHIRPTAVLVVQQAHTVAEAVAADAVNPLPRPPSVPPGAPVAITVRPA